MRHIVQYTLAGIEITAIISVISVLVSIFVEITKQIPGIKKVPTDIYCLIVSIIFTILAYILYCNLENISIEPTMLILCCGLALLITEVATYGWTKLDELIKRNSKGE